MKRTIEEIYQKYSAFHEKYNDAELDDFLMGLARKFEDAEMMYHQLGFLLMHIKATVVYHARPKHLNEAIERAERYLGRYAAEQEAGGEGGKR
jgi:hypothetical protein